MEAVQYKTGKQTEQEVDGLNKEAYETRNTDQESSLALAEKALAIANKLNYPKGKAGACSSIGFYYLQKGNSEKAFEHFLECTRLYEELLDEEGMGLAFYNMGVLNIRTGNLDNAVECIQKSIVIRQKIGDRQGEGACYFQMAYIHQYFKDWEASIKDAQRSYELRKEVNDAIGMSAALMVLSDAYFKRGDFVKAKEILLESLKLREGTNERLGYYATKQRWMEVNIELGDYEEAEKVAIEGLRMAKEENLPLGIIRFLQSYGKLYLKKNDLQEAKIKFEEALEYATKTAYKSIQYELHESLANICDELGESGTAFRHYKKFHELKEDVISLQSNTRLKSVQFMTQVELAKREAELEKTKNAELKKAYDIIEEKNKDITDSIYYAKRIQNSILPKDSLISALFPNHFVLYKPKDIVSGDFYWVGERNGKRIIAAADCTGHGVPGAFMSMAGSSLLNEIVNEKNISSSGQILNHLRERLMQTLQQTGADGESKDGMDIALCVLDGNNLEFSGANNPLYLIRNKELQEYKSDKQPIGVHVGNEKPFASHKIELRKGDIFYIFSDGYADQFGGPGGKKFMSKRFKELLLNVSQYPVNQQKTMLDSAIEDWKQGGNQVDDILVIGINFE